MLPRLEGEEALRQANLAFATEGQGMDDQDRSMYLGDLQLKASGGGKLATAEEMMDAGIEIVYEPLDPDTEPKDRYSQ